MNGRARSPWIAATLCFLLCSHAGADLYITDMNTDAIQAAGGRIVGTLAAEDNRPSRGLRLGDNACLAFPTAGNFHAGQGSVSFRVQPQWDGDDGRDHAFFHLGDGNAHSTIFKTAAGSLRFVYKASPSRHCAADLDATGWKAGEWHQITAGWLPTHSGDLLLVLDVDGRRATRAGAAPLGNVPELLYVGRRGPRTQPAEAVIDDFRLGADPPEVPYPTGPKADVVAVVDATADRPLRRVHDFTTIWNNRDNPLPFKVGDPYYRRFGEAGFSMARLVAFSESWLWGTRVELDDAGRLETDFGDFDRLLDVMLAAGAEPYIRLAYHTPSALVDPSLPRAEQRYALPKDLRQWDGLMERIVRHVRVERKLPVRYWVASLNEGDIPVRRGAADPETIYRLYERTARLVKRIDPEAKVGGPALAWSVGEDGQPAEMLDGFLDYCRRHDLPLDFLCFHGYHKAHPRDYETLIDAVRGAAEEHLPGRAARLEYFLDEWNLWRRDASQDNEYGASYLAAALDYQRRAGLTKSSIVSFNHFRDVPGSPGAKPFVYNDQAIDRLTGLPLIKGPVVTAPYFVWLMHNRLAERELAIDLPGRDGILADDSGGLTATSGDDRVAMILWHFDLMRNDGRRWTVRLKNLPESLATAPSLRLVEYRIDHDHTNPYTDYVLRGKNTRGGQYNLDSGTLDVVRDERLAPGEDGLSFELDLPNLSVALVEIGLP